MTQGVHAVSSPLVQERELDVPSALYPPQNSDVSTVQATCQPPAITMQF